MHVAFLNRFLGGNKIKSFNGKAFDFLTKLTSVELQANFCIDEDFKDPRQIAALQRTVDEKCGYDETPDAKLKLKALESSVDELTATNARLEAELKSSEAEKFKNVETIKSLQNDLKVQVMFNNKRKEEVEQLKTAVEECKTDKVELKSTVTELKADKQQILKQLELLHQLHQKLESQWNATCIAETQELRKNLQFKLEENSEMDGRLQKQHAEIIEKNLKIASLEKKVKSLSD